jgi:acyl carrier protein|tara:strand:- start:5016 stop:5270 length:255 start_codon:yes stop_codon:yes gene_type:complete
MTLMNMIDEDKIKKVFIKIFPEIVDDFNLDRDQSDYENWDSFTHINLISEIEDQFDVQLDTDEIISISSAKTALELIKKKKNDN